MARGVNKVILIGNLGADPEVRYTANSMAIANLRLATSESWKDKNTGEFQERTEWHRVVLYARLAEVAGEYLRKGSKVYIEGSIRTNKWQDQSGQDRYTTEVVGNTMQMLDSKGGSNPGMDSSYSSSSMSHGGSTGSSASAGAQHTQEMPATADFGDEIPF